LDSFPEQAYLSPELVYPDKGGVQSFISASQQAAKFPYRLSSTMESAWDEFIPEPKNSRSSELHLSSILPASDDDFQASQKSGRGK
jgi:hypothetical protein